MGSKHNIFFSILLVQPAQATGDPIKVCVVDTVLLAVKGWQVPGAIDTLRPLMGQESAVIPLMDVNGPLATYPNGTKRGPRTGARPMAVRG